MKQYFENVLKRSKGFVLLGIVKKTSNLNRLLFQFFCLSQLQSSADFAERFITLIVHWKSENLDFDFHHEQYSQK